MCEHCKKTFKNRKVLNQHKHTIHRNHKHICDKCERTFAQKRELNTHKCKGSKEANDDNTCKTCGKTFKTLKIMKAHFKACGINFMCTKCNKSYTSQANLNRHKCKIPISIRCCSCRKQFSSISNLTEHKKNCHICTSCKANFTNMHDLNEHILSGVCQQESTHSTINVQHVNRHSLRKQKYTGTGKKNIPRILIYNRNPSNHKIGMRI